MIFAEDLANLEKIPEFLNRLPPETKFGDWKFSNLLIHLWTWDEEMIRLLYAQIHDEVKALDYNTLSDEEKRNLDRYFQFEYQQLGITYIEWNELMFERYSNLTQSQLLTNFRLGRQRLIHAYDAHIEHFQNKTEVTKQTIGLWKHDLHHIKKGNFVDKEILSEIQY